MEQDHALRWLEGNLFEKIIFRLRHAKQYRKSRENTPLE